MRIAQQLFESGHITYHRTDNPNISADDFPYISALARAHGWAMAPKLRLFKTSATAQLAPCHHTHTLGS
jgi:DNA topoisomerase-1